MIGRARKKDDWNGDGKRQCVGSWVGKGERRLEKGTKGVEKREMKDSIQMEQRGRGKGVGVCVDRKKKKKRDDERNEKEQHRERTDGWKDRKVVKGKDEVIKSVKIGRTDWEKKAITIKEKSVRAERNKTRRG